jgi:hypothetical protein
VDAGDTEALSCGPKSAQHSTGLLLLMLSASMDCC